MNEPIGALATPQMSFFALLVVGGFAGWSAGMLMGHRQGLFTNIIVGIAGSYIGANLANIVNVAVQGSADHFLAALIGSCLLILVWRKVQSNPPPAAGGT